MDQIVYCNPVSLCFWGLPGYEQWYFVYHFRSW